MRDLIYTLNRLSRPPQELEEAWIVHALVREDGLSQVGAGALLGRHKSWVNRRLAMWERLSLGILGRKPVARTGGAPA